MSFRDSAPEITSSSDIASEPDRTVAAASRPESEMPDYLNFNIKLVDLNDDDAKRQLAIQIGRMQEALYRLKESDRVSPEMLEQVISV
jgi:hypothetical protein